MSEARSSARWLLLAVVGIGVFLITLDNTVLYTALPTLVGELNATSTQQLWVVNAYPVVIAGLLLGTGTLGDKIGHRLMFTVGLCIFGIASVIAAFSPAPEFLIGARVLLAIGAATMKMIMSTSRMSMNGVMLISAVCSIVCLSPPEPPSLAAMHRLRYSPAAFRADISLWIARRLDRFLASRCGLVKRF